MANKAISTLAVGSSVYLNVNGSAKEFIVAHQGKPSSLYDDSCNGTWLLMKDIYENRAWHSSNVNNLESSDIHSYLNNTFINLFDSNIRDAIKQVKLPYRKNGGSGGTDQSGANGLSAKIFLLSGYEVGWTTSGNQYFPVDGAKLDYFTASTGGNSKRIANYGGSAAYWWLRSPGTLNTSYVWHVYSDGSYSRNYASFSYGIRPCIILPSTTLVDGSGNVVTVDLTAHKTLVGGTAYTVQGGKCMVNGTVYNILKGRTLINGTGWDITFPSAGTKLSTLDVGQSVFANVGGVRKEFLVVHQGLPSSLYDASCDGTWLLMKDCYIQRTWNTNNVNSYKDSTIYTYLNGTFINLFDSSIQGIIKQVKIPYINGTGGSAIASGANGLSCKVFLLSAVEIGTPYVTGRPNDGAKLDYFNAIAGADEKRIATLDGTNFNWWSRSPYTTKTTTVWFISNSGAPSSYTPFNSYGIRPCIILPSDALVDDEYNLIA